MDEPAQASGSKEASDFDIDPRALIEALPDGVWYVDREGRCRFCNKAGEQWLGTSLAQARERHLRDVLAPSRYDQVQPFLDSALAGRSATFEGLLDTANGTSRWVTAIFVPDTATDGQLRGAFVFTREHASYADAANRQSLVFETMSEGVIITDLDGRITDWNPGATRVFGYEREEMLGRTVRRLYDLDDPLGLEAEIIAEMARDGRWSGVLRFIHKDGSTGVCETVVVPLRNHAGERIATVGVNRNITKRTRIEVELAESHAILEAVAEGTNDAIFVKDRQGRYVMMNRAGARFLGRSPREVIGKDDTELFSPEDAAAFLEVDCRVMDTGVASTVEETVTSHGTSSRLLTSKAPWRDAAGNVIGVIGIARDVTDRWQAQQLAQQRQTELAHVLRLKTMGEMAAGLAHELNQPLAAVTNYAHGTIRRLKDRTIAIEEVLPVAEEISTQAIRAGNIIRRLHGLVRRHPARQEQFDVNELIRGTLELMAADLRQAGIALQLRLGPPLSVAGDPIQIEQVVLNLVRNAIEAMSEGGSLTIDSALSDDDSVEIVVSDTGPGLPQDQFEKIFDPFVTTKTDGLGMGLAICRSIAEAHRGRLSGSNGASGGAEFRLLLPRAVGTASQTK